MNAYEHYLERIPLLFLISRIPIFPMINIMKSLSNLNYTYSMVAESNHISVTQVQRYFDSFVNIPRIRLPESIGIDEFILKWLRDLILLIYVSW